MLRHFLQAFVWTIFAKRYKAEETASSTPTEILPLMALDWIINAFATLFVIIDPVGLVPIFLVVTSGMSPKERHAVALRASVVAILILTVFTLFGAHILNALGITLPAFRIAGGLLLFATAFEMIFDKRQDRKNKAAEKTITAEDVKNIAIFPLAIPLMAGPGAISAAVLLVSERDSTSEIAVLIAIIICIILIAYIMFRLADRLDKVLGDSGRTLVARLLGVILAALSVQFVADGIIKIVQSVSV